MCRIGKSGSLAFSLFLLAGAASAQSPAKPAQKASLHAASSASFEPLERWGAAVLAGDKASLAALYLMQPPAAAQTPQGKSNDPMEEPNFWVALHSMGLSRIDPQILEIDSSRPETRSLVLHINLTVNSSEGAKDLVMSASQVWVHTPDGWRIAATKRGGLLVPAARQLPEPAKPNPSLYPDPAEAKADLDKALAAAGRDHKRVIVVFGANWCYDCHVLDAAFHSKAIAPLVEANYHVVHINVGEYDRNLDLADRFQVALNKGVPCLAVLDSGGQLVASQKQGEFENTVRIGPKDVVAFLNQWKPVKSQ
jgi:thioredoxin 1